MRITITTYLIQYNIVFRNNYTTARIFYRQRHAASVHPALEAQGSEARQLPGPGRLQPGKVGEGDRSNEINILLET